MRLPEVLLLKHRPDRRIKGDSIRAHHAHTFGDQVTRCLGGHATVIGEITFLGVVGRCSRLNEDDIALLQGVAYFLKSLVNVVNKDPRTLWLVTEVKHNAIGVTVLEWNPFGAWRFRTPNMFDCIAVRSDMIARDVEV